MSFYNGYSSSVSGLFSDSTLKVISNVTTYLNDKPKNSNHVNESRYQYMEDISLPSMSMSTCRTLIALIYVSDNYIFNNYKDYIYNNESIYIKNPIDWKNCVDKKSLNAINKHLISYMDKENHPTQENDKYYFTINNKDIKYEALGMFRFFKFHSTYNHNSYDSFYSPENFTYYPSYKIEYPVVITDRFNNDLVYIDSNFTYFLYVVKNLYLGLNLNIIRKIANRTNLYDFYKPQIVHNMLFNNIETNTLLGAGYVSSKNDRDRIEQEYSPFISSILNKDDGYLQLKNQLPEEYNQSTKYRKRYI